MKNGTQVNIEGDGQDTPAVDAHAQKIARLFSEHNEALVKFLSVRLHSVQEAKEVAQESYVRLLSLDDSGAVSFLRAFLFKTAANLAVDRLRSRSRQRQALSAGLYDDLRETPTPDFEAARAEEAEIVRRLLAELPPKCRQAFLLHRIHGEDVAQIARKMQLSERMVRHYIARAVLYCRAGLDATQSSQETSKEPSRG